MNISFPYFDLLLDLVALSEQLRMQSSLGFAQRREDDDAWRELPPPCVRLIDEILKKMSKLGRLCRDGNVDARESALWPLLAFQEIYVEKYEFRRPITLDELTPSAIYQCLLRGNKVLWNGWEVYLGSSRRITNDLGKPIWEPRVWITSPKKDVKMLSGISIDTARAIYRHIKGEPYAGDDGLDDDLSHEKQGRLHTQPDVAYSRETA